MPSQVGKFLGFLKYDLKTKSGLSMYILERFIGLLTISVVEIICHIQEAS